MKPSNKTKSFHSSNKHQNGYDFELLIKTSPSLERFLYTTPRNEKSIDFSNPTAVFTLNKALLLTHYNLIDWQLPKGNLCPPIPSRVDYLHHVSDLFDSKNDLHCLDIGTGANCIYPILGHQEYNWTFVATDTSKESLVAAQTNLELNPFLNKHIELRHQKNSNSIFNGIVKENEKFDLCVCNPPFYNSKEEAERNSFRKQTNIQKKQTKNLRNFGGQSNELWCTGGEERFAKTMIRESQFYKDNCTWFTSLISKKENLRPLKVALKKVGATSVKVIPMEHGEKITRILCWSYIL